MSAANAVYSNDTAITLDWADVSGANKYQIQVSVENGDFSGSLLIDDNTLVASTKSFTDGGTDDRKRFWRWRYSTDGGTTWSEWSEVGSYWLDAGAAADVSVASNKWAMFDPNALSDIYTFPFYPKYFIFQENLYRTRERNRIGTLLSEYVTKKDTIELYFEESSFMTHEHYRAFRRFNEVVKTFFLACNKTNEVNVVPNIWKVQFAEDPSIAMFASGRPGLLTGTVKFMEV